MKNLTRKLLTVLMAVALVFTNANVINAEADTVQPNETDKVHIEGLQEGDVVTLYLIGEGVYVKNDSGYSYQGMSYKDEIKLVDKDDEKVAFADVEKPTSQEINDIANYVVKNNFGKVTLTEEQATVGADGKFEYTTKAASYIAVVTDPSGKRVYNPILLQCSWMDNDTGEFVLEQSNNVNLNGYLYGETSLAKYTKPGFQKTQNTLSVKDTKFAPKTSDPDTEKGEVLGADGLVRDADGHIVYTSVEESGKDTIGIGDVVHYQIQPKPMPQYSKKAKYKVLWVSDEMDEGLTFDKDSLTLVWNGKEIKANDDGEFIWVEGEGDTAVSHRVAKATYTENGFKVSYDYEELRADGDGLALTPVLKYDAVLNEKAVLGHEGNWNNAKMKWTNNPNQDKDFGPDSPEPQGDDIEEKEEKTVVYTFNFVILKVDEKEEAITNNPAKFGVYSDAACTQLIEILETNANGYATSSLYSATDSTKVVWVKEIEQPGGYAINAEPFQITLNWKTCNTESSATRVTRTYTTVASKAIKPDQVGWLVVENADDETGEFRSLQSYTQESTLVKKAYLLSETKQESQSSETLTNDVTGGGTYYYGPFVNTKTPSLPSTGGVGTYIFTIAGVAILATAAFMLIFRKREDA